MTGYEIVSTTFTVQPTDNDVYQPNPGWAWYGLVTATAPVDKRWICAAASLQNIYGTPGVYPEQIVLNGDGTEFTASIQLDNDANGDPVTTTATVRVIAVDA